jgi:serine/threonine protein kinase
MDTLRICRKCQRPLPADYLQSVCLECSSISASPAELRGEEINPEARGLKHQSPTAAELSQFFPQLEIINVLGQGGMGIVYQARQPSLDRYVALKILPAETGRDVSFAGRFNREARALARLNHPNIVSIFDFGQSGPYFYFLMEFVDGANLADLQMTRRRTVAESLGLVSGVCEALQYAHEEGVIHRDIKPANILVDRKGRAKIADLAWPS